MGGEDVGVSEEAGAEEEVGGVYCYCEEGGEVD